MEVQNARKKDGKSGQDGRANEENCCEEEIQKSISYQNREEAERYDEIED